LKRILLQKVTCNIKLRNNKILKLFQLKKLILLFLIGSLFSCNTEAELKKVQVLFTPSFLHPTTFTIDIENKTIEQYTHQNSYYVNEWIDSTSYRSHRIDTLVVHYQKSFPIDDQTLTKFLSDISSAKLDKNIEHYEPVLDGVSFGIRKIDTKNDTISLSSNRTARIEEYRLEYILLDAFFYLAYKSINDYEGFSQIENIQDYFAYGLPIRKVADTPLEYRVWGRIRGCREDNQEFLTLLESFPDDEPILFDLRNGNIAYCLNEVLEEYSEKKQLYLYGSSTALESKKIMDTIKSAEKNGEVLSELRIQAYETHKMIYENWKNNEKIKSFVTKEDLLKTISNKK